MELRIDDWHDWLRLGTITIATLSIFLLVRAFHRKKDEWNEFDKDIWFVLFMWSLAAVVLCVEGIIGDFDFGVRSILVIFATTVTFKLLTAPRLWSRGA
jgi:small-conductance mechanosensitive channel